MRQAGVYPVGLMILLLAIELQGLIEIDVDDRGAEIRQMPNPRFST
jgi:hypothetical protein